ncbi:MAG: hypothetical protein H5U07_02665 [Candidatus Aminicenantes bacterium]|nr:hypothetical protein [Candidatus Aminicenantes bacterium]
MKKRRLQTQLFIAFLILIIFRISAVSASFSPEEQFKEKFNYWKRIEEFYTQGYCNVPTEKMAQKLYTMLSERTSPGARGLKLGLDQIKFGRIPVSGGWAEALSSIRLLNGPGDWDYTGLIDGLSMLISIDPELFLEALTKEMSLIDRTMISKIVNYIPEAYSCPEAKKYLLEKRIKSLNRVDSANLRYIRDICIEELDKGLKDIPKNEGLEKEAKNVLSCGDVNELSQRLKAFICLPDEKNGRALLDSINTGAGDEKTRQMFISELYSIRDDDEALEYRIYDLEWVNYDLEWEHKKGYYLIEYEALTGNRSAAEVLFKLCCLKAASIRLWNALGFLSRIDPHLYLETLYPYREKIKEIYGRYPLSSLYDPLGTRIVKRLISYETVLNSLKKVYDERLVELQTECIKQLESDLVGIKKILFKRFKMEENYDYFAKTEKNVKETVFFQLRENILSFLRLPDAKRALKLLASIPERPVGVAHNELNWSLAPLFWYGEGYSTLEYEMMLGNVAAIRVTLRLLKQVGERERAVLKDSLSRLIRINPQALAEAFYLESQDPYIKENGFPVEGDLELYRKSNFAWSYELDSRIKALGSLAENRFSDLRKKCIEQIERKKKEFESPPAKDKDEFIYEPPFAFKNAIERVMVTPASSAMKNLARIMRALQMKKNNDDFCVLLILQPENGGKFGEGLSLPSNRYLIIEREALSGNEGAVEVLANLYPQSYLIFRDILKDSLSKVAVIRPELFFRTMMKLPEVKKRDIVEIIEYIGEARTFSSETDKEFIIKQRIELLMKNKDLKKNKLVKEMVRELTSDIAQP